MVVRQTWSPQIASTVALPWAMVKYCGALCQGVYSQRSTGGVCVRVCVCDWHGLSYTSTGHGVRWGPRDSTERPHGPRPLWVAAFMSAHSKTPYVNPSMDFSSGKGVVRGRRGQGAAAGIRVGHGVRWGRCSSEVFLDRMTCSPRLACNSKRYIVK